MNGVVLRCSNCGTVQATPGECEACEAAPVRYFCTNHDPGIWSETSTCTRCGARFGEAASPSRAPARPAARPVPVVPDFEPEIEPGPASAPRHAPVYREDDPELTRVGARNPWVDLLVTASRLRRPTEFASDERDDAPVAAPLGGCVKRLFMLFLILAGLFILASMLVGGFLLQLL